MSELKFDPYTGKPITQEEKKGYKFDPYTGKPIEQTESTNNAPQFDPYTGKPITANSSADQKSSTVLPGGNVQQTYGTQQTYGNQQIYGAANNTYGQPGGGYSYDPSMYGQNVKSNNNKTVAFIALGVFAVAFLALIIFGGFQIKKIIDKSKEVTVDPSVEAVVPDEPEVEPAPALEEEVQAEAPAEEVQEETPETVETPAEETPVQEETPAETPAENPENNEQALAADSGVVDENNMFAVRIGESLYQVPETVETFLNDGWVFDDPSDADKMVGTGERFYTNLLPPEGEKRLSISMTITNFSLDAVPAKEGYVSDFSINVYNAKDMGKSVSLKSGAVVLGKATKDDIKAVYGEPDYESESELGGAYFYDDKESSNSDKPQIMISFDEEGMFDSLLLRNSDEPEDFVQTEVSSDVPAYLSKYVAPSELGDDPFSGNFKLDGVVYSLPVPLQVLVDNGWEYDVEKDYSVGAGEEYVLQCHKGDRNITINVANYDAKATMLKNTIVVMISDNASGMFTNDIEFPGGLKASWSESQVLDWFKAHDITDYNIYGTAYNVKFKPGHGKYEIFVEDGQISFMHLRNYGWLED